jgi:hypothetical protein
LKTLNGEPRSSFILFAIILEFLVYKTRCLEFTQNWTEIDKNFQGVTVLAYFNTGVEMFGNFSKTISDFEKATVVLLTPICFKFSNG